MITETRQQELKRACRTASDASFDETTECVWIDVRDGEEEEFVFAFDIKRLCKVSVRVVVDES